jgi:hypothetical protein
MAFYRSSTPRQAALSFKNQLLLSIGGHAFVHLPSSHAEHGDFLPVAGNLEGRAPRELEDGQEVEIIAWRPHSPQGLAYQIRRLSDRHEWWAKAGCLRSGAVATVAKE